MALASKRGCNLNQALGFAYTELELRLDRHPVEASLAFVALLCCASARGVSNLDEDFIADAHVSLKEEVGAALLLLAPAQRIQFELDLERAREMLRGKE
jgi:hypothetical protein